MSDFKLYLLIDHATSNIKSFEEDTIADSHTNYGSLSEIGFEIFDISMFHPGNNF